MSTPPRGAVLGLAALVADELVASGGGSPTPGDSFDVLLTDTDLEAAELRARYGPVSKKELKDQAFSLRIAANNLDARDPDNEHVAPIREAADRYERDADLLDDTPCKPMPLLTQARAAGLTMTELVDHLGDQIGADRLREFLEREQRVLASQRQRPKRESAARRLVEQSLRHVFELGRDDDLALTRFRAALDLITSQPEVGEWSSIIYEQKKWIGTLLWRGEEITAGALHAAWKRARSDRGLGPFRAPGPSARTMQTEHSAAVRAWIRTVIAEHPDIRHAPTVETLIKLAREFLGKTLGGRVVRAVEAYPHRLRKGRVIWRGKRGSDSFYRPHVDLDGWRPSPKQLEPALKAVQREERKARR